MQDMIKEIVDMDEKTRELDAQTQQEKSKIKDEIAVQKKKVYDDYIEKARIRIKKNDAIAQEKAEKQLKESKAEHEKLQKKLQADFEQNCDTWVKQIVENVLK